MDALAVYEFAGVRLNPHAFLIEKEIDESLACIGPRRLRRKADVLSVAEHRIVAHVIEVRALFVIREHETHEGNADRCLAGADAVGGGNNGFDENRSGGGEIADEFFRSIFWHNLVETGEPLG